MEKAKPKARHKHSPIDTTDDPAFVVKAMRRIKPKMYGLIDTLIVSAGLMILLNFGLAKLRQYSAGISLNEAILQLSNIWMLIFNIGGLIFFTLLFLRDAFELSLEDAKDSKPLPGFFVRRFGFKQPIKKDDALIFKPTLNQRTFWPSQKMRVSISGNIVLVSGSWLFLRRVKGVLKSYQK